MNKENEGDKMICPIMSKMGKEKNCWSHDQTALLEVECLKENCAFWVGKCVIVKISEGIEGERKGERK